MRTIARIALLLTLVLALALGGCRQQAASPATEPTATPASAPQATNTPQAAAPTTTPEPPTVTPAAKEPYPPATPVTAQPTTAYPGPTPEPEPTSAPAWRADGEIGPAEYRHERAVDRMAIWWANDGEFLYMAMLAPTSGWVAVGLDPTNRMQGANFILGALVDGEAKIWDAFGMAPVGPNHPEDTELGGTMDVIAFEAVEKNGQTLVEFQIPLDSGDQYDKPLKPGETYPVIVAYGDQDAFTSPHAYRGATEITLDPAP
jgi:hypothetical protein